MDLTLLLDKTVLILVLFGVTLFIAMYSTYAERKVAAFLQDRIGPDRAGPFGILQPLADGVKMFMKEEIIPNAADKVLFIIGPGIAMLTALMTSAVIPWGKDLTLFDRTISLQVADINIGILYIFGVVSLGVYGIMIGGWASNNKFALLGAIRASSQMISYELGMGMSIVAILMSTGSLSLRDIVDEQHGFNWNIWTQPLGFLIFIVCAFAECNRTPFDLPECESELVGGYHTEYSSMKLGFYLFAEYTNMFISSAIISSLYFGGYNFPGMDMFSGNTQALLGTAAFFLKIFFFIFFFMWIRWTVPRFRYDQLMKLGWQVMIPLAIFNILATGAWLTFKDQLGF
ncbi:MAG: NADH-quinone oxidoreductase subunit NuoH [Bacteroidia bacterium]|jgi:NADH-quinone oxidoreductase subunit H|nr:NADH-quinone oxidoreductase subunit NuoH [Bacteroidia bacterium]MBP9180950.1 NADH-quinone oxidoreductase subunit NuoH [Bacteroidia bacterium]